jgi:hypothetical protein
MTKFKSTTLSLLLFIAFFTSLISNDAKAQSYGINHSFFLTDTGKINTVKSYKAKDNLIDIFSPDEIFILPEMIKHMNATYIINDSDVIYTIDPDGYVYENNYDIEVDSRLSKSGGNFFTTRDNSIVIIMGNGTIKKIEDAVNDLDSKIKIVGGNYIVTRKGSVYIINTFKGEVTKVGLEVKPAEVATEGGNFLITKKGNLVSFGVEVNGDIKINTERNSAFRRPKFVGGNYLFDRYNNIHTISANGVINNGNKNRKIKVDGNKKPSKIGHNYFMFDDGSFYNVDSNGIFNYIKKVEDRIIKTTR